MLSVDDRGPWPPCPAPFDLAAHELAAGGGAAAPAARFAGGWFRTGDAAVMAADGAITHLGRLDELMNAGGLRVAPQEVEAALAEFPGIGGIALAEVAVRPDVTVIGAFYTAAETLAREDLDAFAAARLARSKRPRFWRRLPELPRTPAGKTDRRALSALGPPPAEEPPR